MDGLSVGLVIDGMPQGFDLRPRGLQCDGHQVSRVVGSASLTRSAVKALADCHVKPGLRIGGDKFDAGQAAGDEVTEEPPPAPSSLVASCSPRVPRYPSALTPVATRAYTPTTRLPSRTFGTTAVPALNVNGPASSSRRVWNGSTYSSGFLSISETRDLMSVVVPRDCTSLSIRTAKAPSS